MKVFDMFARVNAAMRGSAMETGELLSALVAYPMATGTAASGAVTVSGLLGKITTESLTTAQNAVYTLTLTNDQIAAADIVLVSIANGTNTQGTPMLLRVTPAAGSVVITIQNKHDAAQALNGTLVVSYVVHKAA